MANYDPRSIQAAYAASGGQQGTVNAYRQQQATQGQGEVWDPNTPEGKKKIDDFLRSQGMGEADYRNADGINDSAMRNMNDNAFWYGGQGQGFADAERARAEQMRQGYANRVGPQVDQTGYNVDRTRDTLASQQQNAGLGMLYRTAMGQSGPSVAQMQAGNQVAQAAANMRAQAASARGGGGNAAAAMRTAIRQGGAAGVAAANQGGILRAQEQLAAQQAYMQGASQVRGAEQARMGQSANWAFGNTGAQQANQRQNDQQSNFMEGIRTGVNTANQQGQMGREDLRERGYRGLNRASLEQEGQDQGWFGKLLGTVGSGLAAVGPLAVASDERLKTGVGNGAGEIRSALDNLSPKSFEYKDGANGEGERLGIMAQDLEKSKYGKSIVQKDGDGMRMVDGGGGLNMALAAIADLHQRMKKFEGKK